MAITTEDYAFWSDVVYKNNLQQGDIARGAPSGNEYEVMRVVSHAHPSGYYGVIVKNTVTGDLVVVHRGTEPGGDWWRDIVEADAQMVIGQINQQFYPANALVNDALGMLAESGPPGEVFVTGHSLGGALAQMTASRNGVHGETFNAFGAAGIYGTPAGGESVKNHVRALDLVGLAGTHYGEVIFYATAADTTTLYGMSEGPLWQSISSYAGLLPPATHASDQFYGDGAIINEENIERHQALEFFYDAYGALIRGAATSVTGLSTLIPDEVFQTKLFVSKFIVNARYEDVARSAFLGTEQNDVRAGTAESDFYVGMGGDDNLAGGDEEDVLVGGADVDTLRGETGDDVLDGGIGNDYLSGGSGSDQLFGGAGQDRYDFHLQDFEDTPGSHDEIADVDGAGRIEIDSVPLEIGRRLAENVWESLDEAFLLTADPTLGATELLITHKETGSAITVREWNNGALGISLGGPIYQPEEIQVTHGGTDLTDYIDPRLDTPAGQGIHAMGWGGRDMIWGSVGGGDDVLEGGLGSDLITGGGGKDTIDGGGDDDFIAGFGEESTVTGGEGDDVIVTGGSVGVPIFSLDDDPLSEDQVWRDIAQYFNWQQAELLTVGSDGKLSVSWDADLAKSFDYSGPSAVAGWSYRFRSTGEDTYDLRYFSTTAPPEGEQVGAHTISHGGGSTAHYEKGVFLYGGSGNDTIAGSEADDVIDGGADKDLIVGLGGNDTILGGAGNDIFSGGDGNDTLYGQADNDIAYGEGGDDLLFGGTGNDTLWGDMYEGAQDAPGGDDFIDGGNGNDELSGQGGDDQLFGGRGVDLVIGGSGNDVLLGGEGADELQGGEGNDSLDGGTENDKLFGQAGTDLLIGGDGDDLLLGGDDNDVLVGGAGADELQGGDGSDSLDGGSENDRLFGGAGNDSLHGGAGEDSFMGGGGHDRLMGGIGDDLLIGEDGNDVLLGGAGIDELQGGADNDSLDGGEGVDRLFGQDGDDYLSGGDGDDRLNGGAGNDALSGGNDHDQLSGQDGNDTLHGGYGDDKLWGDVGDDTLSGDAGADQLVGGTGHDQLTGGQGNDVLYGSEGDDHLDGGAGDDSLIGDTGNDVLAGGTGVDAYFFDRGFGSDTINLSEGSADSIVFRDGIESNELVFERTDADLLIRVSGQSDTVLVINYFSAGSQAIVRTTDGYAYTPESFNRPYMLATPISGGDDNDELQGTADSDRLYGRDGDDTLVGGEGDDFLDGGIGNDTLFDGAGSDVMLGGAGDDHIHFQALGGSDTTDVADGGAGNDVYHIEWYSGYDVISGLAEASAGIDRIVLGDQITPNSISNYQISGDDLMIMVGTASSIQNVINLQGFLAEDAPAHVIEFIDGSTLTASEFRFQGWNGTEEDDTYAGGHGPDEIRGNGGNDTLSGGAGSDKIQGGYGDDVIYGGDGNDTVYGDTGSDVLYGGAGDDKLYYTLYPEAGDTDRYFGGTGDDTYYIRTNTSGGTSQPSTGASNAKENAGEGNDTVVSNYYHIALSDNIENLTAEGVNYSYRDFPRRLEGNDLDNVIRIDPHLGGFADHRGREYVLDGGSGNDILIGSEANETYVVDSLGDTIVEPESSNGYNSNDTVRTAISYSIEDLPAIENIELIGLETTTATGNSGDNRLNGELSNAANTLIGGLGNDTYLIGLNDIVVEAEGEGTDTIVVSRLQGSPGAMPRYDVQALANIEIYRLDESLSGGNILNGNDDSNILFGNSKGNWLYGGAGNDQLDTGKNSGSGYTDRLDGGAGDDLLTAWQGLNNLTGGRGDDEIVIASGEDRIHYQRGDGHDVIRAMNGNVGGLDRLQFTSEIRPEEVTWSRQEDDLVIAIAGSTGDLITVKDYWLPAESGGALSGVIEEFYFAFDQSTHKGTLDQLPFVNSPPEASYASLSVLVTEGNALVYALPEDTFTDAPDDTLSYSLAPDAPTWLSIDVSTGALSGTAPSTEVGTTTIEVIATDSWGQTARKSLSLNVSKLILGTEAADQIIGTEGSDDIRAMAGDDRLDGNGGADILVGGSDNDTYVVRRGDEQIIEFANDGNDLVESHVDYQMMDNLEQLTLVEGSSAMLAAAGEGSQVLVGNSNANMLDGGSGADEMRGAEGDDTYRVDDAGDVVIELAGAGYDTVRSSVATTLSENVEALVLVGDAEIDGTGNSLSNVMEGNDAANLLDGGLGDDDLAGGLGDDSYVVDSAGDEVDESEGAGIDTILRKYETNFVLTDSVENLALLNNAVTGVGNVLNNAITGNDSDNDLMGLDGDDVLTGGAGNDYLDGGAGIDRLEGGAGDDTYIVDDSNDVVAESSGNGADKVQASMSYTLSDNVETLFLVGSGAIDGTANGLDNYIAGNIASNVIDGQGGNDTLVGGGGNDTLMGGAGDDRYIVNTNSGSDVIDNTNGGVDGVFFTDGITRERLSFNRDGDDLLISVDDSATPAVRALNHFLGGDTAIDYVQPDGGYYLTTAEINQIVADGGPGGDHDQVIEGTASGEQLVGSNGKDLIKGLAGNDQLFGMAGGDTLQGGDGDDYLAGGNGSGSNSGADRIEGGAGTDTLAGEDGNNTLIGGLGNDSYIYGGGKDTIDNSDGGYDGVFFNNGINAARLSFSRDDDDLLITVDEDPESTVRVTGHFTGGDAAIDYVQPDGGSLLDTTAINALVGDGGGGGDPGGGTPGNDDDYSNVVEGSSSGEQLLGSGGRDLMRGLGGADTMFAFGGDDKLEGGDGNDDLYGGNGSFSGSGNDILIGGTGSDSLKGEDGNDYLMGGAGDDSYYYAPGSGSDTIDNTGGGTDYIYFASIARERLSFHRDGDDLVVRVDDDANQQSRVLKHFQGGQYAIAFVQPGDGGYAIPASQFDALLTPMTGAGANLTDRGGAPTPMWFSRSEIGSPNGTLFHHHLSDQLWSGGLAYLDHMERQPAWEERQWSSNSKFSENVATLSQDEGGVAGWLRRLGRRVAQQAPVVVDEEAQPISHLGVQKHTAALRLEDPVSVTRQPQGEANRELDLLVEAIGSYPPAVTDVASPYGDEPIPSVSSGMSVRSEYGKVMGERIYQF